MEQQIILKTNVDDNNGKGRTATKNGLPRKKKRGALHFFRAAMYMLRIKKSKSTPHVDAAVSLGKLVGSMRPLHIQDNNTPPPQLPKPSTKNVVEANVEAEEEKPKPVMHMEQLNAYVEQVETFSPPFSPAQASTSSSSHGPTSRYASAMSLHDLVESLETDDEDEEDCYYDDKCADEMIDSKAEEFIAQFYEQMRIQHETYHTTRQNHQHSRGSRSY